MDEIRYRETYAAVNERRCHFEKAINARACACRHMRRFNLADREGVGCAAPEAHRRCADWLRALRKASRFALGLPGLPEALPHRQEAKVQAGGLLGLAGLLRGGADVPDITALMDHAEERYGALAEVPLPDIVTAVAEYEPRRRKQRTPRAPSGHVADS